MREFEIPSNFDTEPSEYAGQEQMYKNRSMMKTTSGERVIIMNYLKDVGLYVVMNVDSPGTVSPAYKINPDKLVKIEEDTNK